MLSSVRSGSVRYGVSWSVEIGLIERSHVVQTAVFIVRLALSNLVSPANVPKPTVSKKGEESSGRPTHTTAIGEIIEAMRKKALCQPREAFAIL